VLVGDMNGHVGSNSVCYDGTHGHLVMGLEIGMQMAPGFWSLQMAKPSYL